MIYGLYLCAHEYPLSSGTRKTEHVEMQCPRSYRDARGRTLDRQRDNETQATDTWSPHGPARHADAFKMRTSTCHNGRKRKKEGEKAGGGKEEREREGKELAFGAWLSSQPWSPWVPLFAFFSQDSWADNLRHRTQRHHQVWEWLVLYSTVEEI